MSRRATFAFRVVDEMDGQRYSLGVMVAAPSDAPLDSGVGRDFTFVVGAIGPEHGCELHAEVEVAHRGGWSPMLVVVAGRKVTYLGIGIRETGRAAAVRAVVRGHEHLRCDRHRLAVLKTPGSRRGALAVRSRHGRWSFSKLATASKGRATRAGAEVE
jgi:hypothetical protein